MKKYNLRDTFPISACFVFLISLFATQFTAAQEVELPDTPVAKRFGQVLECLNQTDNQKRNVLIDKIFDEDDREEVKTVAEQMSEQFMGARLLEIVKSEESKFVGICATNRMKIVIGIVVAGEGKLIKDVSISPHEEETELKAVGDFFPIVGEDGKTVAKCRGVWEAKGYGYILEVTDTELITYNYTGKFGWPIEFESNLLFKPGKTDAQAVGTMHPLEPGYNLTRLDALPDVCKKEEWKPIELFDAFADTMTVYYPFFKERNVDWQARIKSHRPKVNDEMSEAELFDVMASMLNNLHDGHVSLSASIDGKERRAEVGDGETVARLRKAIKRQDKYKSGGSFIRRFMRDLVEHVQTETLGGKSQTACNKKLIWGRANDNVGYLYISGMYGYSNGEMDEEVADLHAAMNKILTELSDTKALIIDISMNPGGTDAISIELASHFADQKRVGFSKWPATQKQYRNDRHVTPYSEQSDEAVMYTKPIYLVTNDFSASAAEIFTMCMRSFPHVTTVGKPTEGALSDILDKSLPNGWGFGISNEVYVDHEGICYEGPGVPPAIEMEVFDAADILNLKGHSEAIQKVVEMALEVDTGN